MSMQVNRPDPDSLNKPVDAPSHAAPDAELANKALELFDSLDAVKDQPMASLQSQKNFEADLASLDTALEEIAKGAFEQPAATSESEDEPVKMSSRARLPKMEILDPSAGKDVSKVASRAMGDSRPTSQILSDLGEELKAETPKPTEKVRLPGQEDGRGRLVNKDERFITSSNKAPDAAQEMKMPAAGAKNKETSSLEDRIHSLDSNTGGEAVFKELKTLTPAQRQEIRDKGHSILANMTNKTKIEDGLKHFEASDAKKLKIQVRVAEVISHAAEGTAVKEVGETTRKWGKGTIVVLSALRSALQTISEIGSKISSGLKNLLSLMTFKSTAQAASHSVEKVVVYPEFDEADLVEHGDPASTPSPALTATGKSDAITETGTLALVSSFEEAVEELSTCPPERLKELLSKLDFKAVDKAVDRSDQDNFRIIDKLVTAERKLIDRLTGLQPTEDGKVVSEAVQSLLDRPDLSNTAFIEEHGKELKAGIEWFNVVLKQDAFSGIGAEFNALRDDFKKAIRDVSGIHGAANLLNQELDTLEQSISKLNQGTVSLQEMREVAEKFNTVLGLCRARFISALNQNPNKKDEILSSIRPALEKMILLGERINGCMDNPPQYLLNAFATQKAAIAKLLNPAAPVSEEPKVEETTTQPVTNKAAEPVVAATKAELKAELDPAAQQKLVTDVLARIFEKASTKDYEYPAYMTSVDIHNERTLNPEFRMALDTLLKSPGLESVSQLLRYIDGCIAILQTPQRAIVQINRMQSPFEQMQELAISVMKDQPKLVKQLKSCKSGEDLLKVIEGHFKPALAALEKKIKE